LLAGGILQLCDDDDDDDVDDDDDDDDEPNVRPQFRPSATQGSQCHHYLYNNKSC